MGNPSGAVTSVNQPNNYLMEKPEFAVSYSRDLGRPNWVSWHLSDEWTGTLTRVDTFRPDPAMPPEWYRVQSFDFAGSGFDRGHMTPNADRDKETSSPINQATFLMSNMVAQAPDNNQGPWASLEGYLRTLLPAGEVYIVAGGSGAGGTGSNGGLTTTLADGHVTVPAYTWKAALVIAKGSDDISRVDCAARTIAVIMPNTQGIRSNAWETYLTTVDAIETLTGYDLFSNLPRAVQACVEAGTNGTNPPLDTIAPTVVCASADGAWHPGNVTLACTASDAGSGMASAGDASFTLATAVVNGVEDANASTNSRQVCDVAGNCATASITGNKIDRKGPVITVTAPLDGAVFRLGQAANSQYTCTDTGSATASCVGTVANLSPIDTSTLGPKSFVVNATDAVGNASSTTVSYDVIRRDTTLGNMPDASGIYGGSTTLNVTLTSDGNPVSGKTVNFSLNGSPVGSAVTNAAGVATLSDVTLSGLNAANYPGAVQAAFLGDSDYSPAATSAGLVVSAKALTVTAGSSTKVYGTADPALATSQTGILEADLAAITLNTTRDAGENAGDYATTATALGGNIGNYNVAFVPGIFAITKADSTTTLTCTDATYTGSAIETCTATATGVGGLNQAVATVTYTNNTNVGTAGASATYGGDANHNGSTGTGSFNITRRDASVTPNAAGKEWGAPDPALSGTLIGFVAGDGVTVTYTRAAGEIGGDYQISATLAPAAVLSNYNVTYNTAIFKIVDTLAPVTVVTSQLPAANVNGWNNSNVTVALTASETPFSGSGVKNITVTLSGAMTGTTVTNGLTASVLVNTSGTTTMTYFATDNVGNKETAKTLVIKLDKIMPEAYNQFDPVTKTVKVYGRDSLSGLASSAPVVGVCVASTWGKDDAHDSEHKNSNPHVLLCTYTITDLAGNTLVLVEKVKTGSGDFDKGDGKDNKWDEDKKWNAEKDKAFHADKSWDDTKDKQWHKDKKDKTWSDSQDKDYHDSVARDEKYHDDEKNDREGENHEVQVRVISTQYNNGAVVNAAYNLKAFEWSVDSKGGLKELEQNMIVGQGKTRQQVNAHFDARKNQTTIQKDTEDGDHKGKDKPVITTGLVLLRLAVVNGGLSIEY